MEFSLCTLTPEVQCLTFHQNNVVWQTNMFFLTEWQWFEQAYSLQWRLSWFDGKKLSDEAFNDHSCACRKRWTRTLIATSKWEKMAISTTSNKLLLTIKWKAKNIILSEQFRNPIKQNRKKTHTDTPSTRIHNLLLFCLKKSTSIKCGGVKLVVWAKTSSFNGMMQSSMYCAKLSGSKPPVLMKWCNHPCIVHIKVSSEYELYISTLWWVTYICNRTCKSKGLILARGQKLFASLSPLTSSIPKKSLKILKG